MTRPRDPIIVCLAAGFGAGKTKLMNALEEFVSHGTIKTIAVSEHAVGVNRTMDPVDRQLELINTSVNLVETYGNPRIHGVESYDLVVMDRSPMDYYDVVLDWATSHPDPKMRKRMQDLTEYGDLEERVHNNMADVFTILPPVPPASHLGQMFYELPADSPRKRYLEERYGLEPGTLHHHDAVELWRLSHARSSARITEYLRAWGCDYLAMPQQIGVHSREKYFTWQVEALGVVIDKYQKHVGLTS